MLNRVAGVRNSRCRFDLAGLGCRLKTAAPLLATPAALLLSQGQAKAVLVYNIFESAGNVVVQTSGSLNLAGAIVIGGGFCGYNNGFIASYRGFICTGPNAHMDAFALTGPFGFGIVGTGLEIPGSSASGLSTYLDTGGGVFNVDSSYISTNSIVSSATFNGTTLAGLGFTTTGLIGPWTLSGTSETIQMILGPLAAAVPGPLPLLGAGAAFGWSRRLRKRIATPLSTTPLA